MGEQGLAQSAESLDLPAPACSCREHGGTGQPKSNPEHSDRLFEAITETYVPLFLVFESLLEDGIDFRLTLSVTPTLASMLGDTFLQSRYLRNLERLMGLAEKEVVRTRYAPAFQVLARMYRDLFPRVHDPRNGGCRDPTTGIRLKA